MLFVGLPALIALWLIWKIRDPYAQVTTDEREEPNEKVVIARLVSKAKASVVDHARPDGLYKRDAHPFAHGCAHAQLLVDDDVDQRLRAGVFAKPHASYDVWVRFSNGLEDDDTKDDARGMAIKVLGVDGPRLLSADHERAEEIAGRTQDFVMIDYPAFFTRTLEDYERFFEIQSANPKPYAFFLPSVNPCKWKLHEFYHALHAIRRRVVNPLEVPYYSMAAFRLGPRDLSRNVKFSLRPCAASQGAPVETSGPHRLRSALSRSLSHAPACFAFLIQLQDPTKSMPIEDTTIEWRESDSPFLHAATLIIPRQEIDTAVTNQFCENLSFDPWHGVQDHYPVGAMNRARRAVYEAVAKFRHDRNGKEFPKLAGAAVPVPPYPGSPK
jgi:hypothetical protein